VRQHLNTLVPQHAARAAQAMSHIVGALPQAPQDRHVIEFARLK